MLEYLHRKSISCALIQETHLKQSDVARFQNKYYKLSAFSCALNKTKGVLILVNRKLNLTIEHLGSDEKGRFVFIRCKIYNNRLALFSIYGPNETDSAFLTQISKTQLNLIDLWRIQNTKGESHFSVLPLPLSFSRSRESKGYPNSRFDQRVGLRGSGRYPLKPRIFKSLLETKGYPEHTAQPATMAARSPREFHKCKYFRLK